MVNCDQCGKCFNFPSQLERHLSSKFPCYSKPPSKTPKNNVQKNDYDDLKNEYINLKNVYEKLIEEVKPSQVTKEDKNECRKCGKLICNKYYLKVHEAKCNGLHSLQCSICHKMFSSSSSKSIHMKNVKCKPQENKEQFSQPVNGGTVNITNNNITNDNSINDNRTLNNHVYLVNFSDTDYSHISVDQIVRMVAKCHASPSRFFNMMITEAHKNEYANVGLSNIKGNYATIYDEQQFLKVSAEEIAEEIGIKIAHRMDDCVTDSENKEILKHGNIYKRVKSYSFLFHSLFQQIEDVVRGISSSEYDDETSDALRTLNMNKRDAVDKINQSIRFGLHNVHINMKGMKGKMHT